LLKDKQVSPPARLVRGKPVSHWIEQARDFEATFRAEAVGVLGTVARQGEKSVLPVLAEAIKDKEVQVAEAAASALGESGQPEALPLAAALLGEPPAVRMRALEAMGQIGRLTRVHAIAREAVAALVKAVKEDEDGDVAQGAALVLAYLGAEQTLLELAGEEATVSIRAIAALGYMPSPAALPVLSKALKDEETRHTAIHALAKIGPPAKEVMPELARLLHEHLNDKEPHERWSLALAIVHIEPENEKLFPSMGRYVRRPGDRGPKYYPPGAPDPTPRPPGAPGPRPPITYPPDTPETWQRAAEALKKRYGGDKR
jgi:hypothetical protein